MRTTNNKNREYPALGERVAETYSVQSKATLRNKLSDPYVKAFRWASDRIGNEGVICFVSNNSFLDNIAFDGMRSCLESEFSKVYHADLKGNAHTSGERRQREAGNIFDDQIRVGIGITLLVKKRTPPARAEIFLYEVADSLPSDAKRAVLDNAGQFLNLPLTKITPDERHTWLTQGERPEFRSFLPVASKTGKDAAPGAAVAIFKLFSLGVVTSRDSSVYNYSRSEVARSVRSLIASYNDEVARLSHGRSKLTEGDHYSQALKWTDRLKEALQAGKYLEFDASKIRNSLYRPFARQYLYFDQLLNQRQYLQPIVFPTAQSESENLAIVSSTIGFRSSYTAIVTSFIPELHFGCSTDGFQCFPFYTYAKDGTHRRENITDWALEQFRAPTATPPSPSGTSSTTSTPSCIILSTASASPPTSAANSPASRSPQ